MSKGGGAHGFKAYAGLLPLIASTKSSCHNFSCLEDVMIQSVKKCCMVGMVQATPTAFRPSVFCPGRRANTVACSII